MSRRPSQLRHLLKMTFPLMALLFVLGLLLNGLVAPDDVNAEVESGPTAQDAPINSEFQVVLITIKDRAQLELLAEWVEPVPVVGQPDVYRIEATADDLAWLDLNGYDYVIDQKLTAELQTPRQPNPSGGGIPGYACYRTVEETYQTAEDIVTNYPTLAEWIDIGDSWAKTQNPNNGYDLYVLKLTNQNTGGDKPVLYVTSSIHAREYTPAETMTRFAEKLVTGYGTDPDITWLLDHQEIHLVLQANPDGRKIAEAGELWRKNVNNNACASGNYGIDLNRNFDFQWNCCGGSSGDPCNQTYRGASAASEPETQTYQAYGATVFQDQRPDPLTSPAPEDATGVYLDIHSSGKLVLWSWGFTATPPPNASGLQSFGRHMAYFNDHEPEQSIGLYPTDGTTKDYFYGVYGVAAYTIEQGTQFFEQCDYFENTVVPDNHNAYLYAAKAARAPYMLSKGPDAVDLALTSSSVPLSGATVTLTATLNDTRFNNVNGTEPTQNTVAAEAYVDTPPWDGGTAIPLAAADGNFNSPVEGVTGTINTTGLTAGQHLIYVRGQDAAGNWGVVTAIFLYVLDPASAGTIQGYVREAGSNAPLAATVSATGGFITQTNPATGFYSLLVTPGSYELTASAPDHASQTQDVITSAGQTSQVNFYLDAICTIFADDVESGNLGWTAQTPWAITNSNSNSPTHSWTDSPGGNYSPNANTSLTSPVFDMSDSYDLTLSFAQVCNTEANYDFCIVEASNDGGASWSELARYAGLGTAWNVVELDASLLDNQANARLRFRLTSDGSVVRDGWYVDDVRLRGAGSCSVPPLSESLYLPIVAR